jgi:hypothetical protein
VALHPHEDGGGCYVRGSTEVVEGVAPRCDEPGCDQVLEDFWAPVDNEFTGTNNGDAEAELWADEERDYNPDEDRTP